MRLPKWMTLNAKEVSILNIVILWAFGYLTAESWNNPSIETWVTPVIAIISTGYMLMMINWIWIGIDVCEGEKIKKAFCESLYDHFKLQNELIDEMQDYIVNFDPEQIKEFEKLQEGLKKLIEKRKDVKPCLNG